MRALPGVAWWGVAAAEPSPARRSYTCPARRKPPRGYSRVTAVGCHWGQGKSGQLEDCGYAGAKPTPTARRSRPGRAYAGQGRSHATPNCEAAPYPTSPHYPSAHQGEAAPQDTLEFTITHFEINYSAFNRIVLGSSPRHPILKSTVL